jgi:competence protein ComEC
VTAPEGARPKATDDAPESLPPPDLRLVPPAVACWIGGLVSTLLPSAVGLTVAAAALCLAVVAGLRRWRAKSVKARRRSVLGVVAVALACLAASSLAGGWRLHTVRTGPVAQLANQGAVGTAELVVTADPTALATKVVGTTRGPDQVIVQARLERLIGRGLDIGTREPVLVLGLRSQWGFLLPSQRVRTEVRLGAADPTDDLAAWVRVIGRPTLIGGPSAVQRGAGFVRERLRDSTVGLGGGQRGLVAGLVDGDTSQLPADVADDFKVAGLTHLAAVSGSNVSFVLAAVLLAGRWLGLRGRALPVLGVLGLGGFLILARPEPSVLRATVMGLLVVAAMVRRGSSARTGLPALCAAVVVLVLVDPFLARSAGFALSVLATVGLLVLAPGWRERLRRRMPGSLADGIAVATAAQVAVMPILILLAPTVSLVSVPANLLAEPAVPAATVLGVIAAVTGVAYAPAGHLFAWLAGLPAGWIVEVAHTFAQLPFATVGWPAGVGGSILMFAVMVILRLGWPWLRRHRFAVVAAVAVALLVMASPLVPGSSWPPRGWIAVNCDVGQGDGLVIAAGKGAAIVIDAGPDPDKMDRCLTELGIHRIGLVVLTHFHADHVEGLPGVLRHRSVAEVEVSPLADPPDEVARVRAWTRAAHIPVTIAMAGEERAYDGIRWTVLWPRRLIAGDSPPNNASIVLRLESQGVVFLLTGDVEPPAQAELMDDPAALRADVLKVPHHGSRYQDPDLLRAVGARFAMISVGLGNPYGHPALSTIALLESYGAEVKRTDLDGAIAVVGPASDLHLETSGPS